MQVNIFDEDHFLTTNQVDMMRDLLSLASQKLTLIGERELDITIVDDQQIQAINRDNRQLDRPTDVLSFPTEDDDLFAQLAGQWGARKLRQHMGDLIISYPRAMAQADEYGHSLERELAFLTVHGFLHLNGYDHQTPEEEAVMFQLQEEVLSDYGLTR